MAPPHSARKLHNGKRERKKAARPLPPCCTSQCLPFLAERARVCRQFLTERCGSPRASQLRSACRDPLNALARVNAALPPNERSTMFKRRDWRNLKGSHGGAGAGESSSDDSDSDAEERRARLRQTGGDTGKCLGAGREGSLRQPCRARTSGATSTSASCAHTTFARPTRRDAT
eukprot:365630-Chlamydomonas_euryale.AAC.13